MEVFGLAVGQSCQILNADAVRGVFVYRISAHHLVDAELKIVRDGMAAIVLSSKQKHRSIDFVATGNVYLEAMGQSGFVAGTYEFVGKG
jgi:hypothetical protein